MQQGAQENQKTEKKFTWEEVAKHNTAKSLWIIFGTKVYDITDFLNKHPGGREMILISAGKDCTNLLPSYHPFSNAPEEILKKYYIGDAASFELPQYTPDSGFYKEVREKVGEYFKKNKIQYRNPPLFSGLALIIFVLWPLMFCSYLGYATNYLGEFSLWTRIFFSFLYGWCQVMPTVHVVHDSSHTAWGKKPYQWFVGRFFFDYIVGCSMTAWLHQHTLGHHLYTNVYEVDPDLPAKMKGDVRRTCERQQWVSVYKFQWLYLPILYGFFGIKMRIQDITETFLRESNGYIRANPHSKLIWISMIISKSLFVFYRIVAPVVIFQVCSIQISLLHFLVAELTTAYWLALCFQVSHVSTECESVFGKEDKKLEIYDEWAVSQILTSVDYDHESSVTTWLAGALNYQVVHHLFPSVSQYYYPEIAPIVKETCKKYGIKFNLLDSFYSALKGHLKLLKIMGEQGQKVSIHIG